MMDTERAAIYERIIKPAEEKIGQIVSQINSLIGNADASWDDISNDVENEIVDLGEALRTLYGEAGKNMLGKEFRDIFNRNGLDAIMLRGSEGIESIEDVSALLKNLETAKSEIKALFA